MFSNYCEREDLHMYKCNSRRLQDSIEQFSQFGATLNGGVTRLSLSKEDVLARNYFCKCCEELGMEIKVDDMANIYAMLPGKKKFRQLLWALIWIQLKRVESLMVF